MAEGLSFCVKAGTYEANKGGNGSLCGTKGTNSSVLAESSVALGGIFAVLKCETNNQVSKVI